MSSWTVRMDARKEKSQAFEDTKTWRTVKTAWEEKKGRKAAYARIPDLVLASPKLSRPRTTQWYADNVLRRYESCRGRARDGVNTTPASS